MTRTNLLPPLALLSTAATASWSLAPSANGASRFAAPARMPALASSSPRAWSCHVAAIVAQPRSTQIQLSLLDDSAPTMATQWDDSSFGGGETSSPLSAPARRTSKPIETFKVGIVSGPYKRRRGIHAEVLAAHPDAGMPDSMHRLWFGHEVLDDVAKLRGYTGLQVDIERFAEAVVEFLQQKGVDLSDPDWGMQDDDIPFSVEHLPLRTLFAYYEELPQHLADVLFADYAPPPPEAPEEGEGDLAKVPEEALENPDDFPCLGALGWGANYTAMGIGDESHAKPLDSDYYYNGSN